ncbi:MAG: cyclopropane-fatty-acyl-phospholipid synthase family protein [Pseudomonadota bacterium]|nr:cyclopropane-fatty-acyl-phospholipid synthase family protein [Pseudomonadota bacterium]
MSLIETAIHAFEDAPLPDFVTRPAIDWLVDGARKKTLGASSDVALSFAREMESRPIAEFTDRANEQHYEVPAAFFTRVLGPRLKYSSCLYPTGKETLAEAEVIALRETVAHAGLVDGQDVLELGCGWGSLTLFMAETYPRSKITAVSNSASQREFILARAAANGLSNVEVLTCDMNDLSLDRRFDRVVSVEMFEHMANWRALLTRVNGWLKPDGRLFIHVFAHARAPYRFDVADKTDWIAQHFFAGGVMPNHDLIHAFPDLFAVEDEWRWSGTHYEKTALDWLANFDADKAAIAGVFREVYGANARVWMRRWRLFFLATAGLFGHRGGEEWGVSHYRLAPVAQKS